MYGGAANCVAVTVDDCKITITITLELVSRFTFTEEALAKLKEDIRKDIQENWTGLTFSWCAIEVVVKYKGEAGAGANACKITIHHAPPNGPNYVSNVTAATNSGAWSDRPDTHEYGHEAGHLMGIGDQYCEAKWDGKDPPSFPVIRKCPDLGPGEQCPCETLTDAEKERLKKGERVGRPCPNHDTDKMATLFPPERVGPRKDAIEKVIKDAGKDCPAECCGCCEMEGVCVAPTGKLQCQGTFVPSAVCVGNLCQPGSTTTTTVAPTTTTAPPTTTTVSPTTSTAPTTTTTAPGSASLAFLDGGDP